MQLSDHFNRPKKRIKPGVFLTFDVECSMGGAWQNSSLRPVPPSKGMMGRYGKRSLGLPLICDILARHHIKATFFLEPFNAELGWPGQTESVCYFLVNQGHDVQLHIHPNHFHYGLYRQGQSYCYTDQISELRLKDQKKMVIEGANRIAKWTGRRPIAFRAGNMGASEATLSILPSAEIWMDSSYTFPYVGGQCRFSDTALYNGSKWYGDVLEVALSGFKQPHWPGLYPCKPLDLMGASYEECRDAARMICDAGADAVLILHSFSLFKKRDLQYNNGKLNWVVTKRFERLCEWLNTHRETYPSRTFLEMGRLIKKQNYAPKAIAPCMIKRPFRALVRKAIQGLNHFYWF